MADRDEAKRDLLSALARLRSGLPRNADLILLSQQGKLKINPSSVALEAGRSRTLIGMDGCRYPDVRREVLASKDQTPLQMKRSAALKAMSAEIKRLEEQITIKESALVAALLRIDQLAERLANYEPTGKNVVQFPKKSSNL